MQHLLTVIGGAVVVVGCIAAILADRLPVYRKMLESFGGGLIVGGVTLLGFAFPAI